MHSTHLRRQYTRPDDNGIKVEKESKIRVGWQFTVLEWLVGRGRALDAKHLIIITTVMMSQLRILCIELVSELQ